MTNGSRPKVPNFAADLESFSTTHRFVCFTSGRSIRLPVTLPRREPFSPTDAERPCTFPTNDAPDTMTGITIECLPKPRIACRCRPRFASWVRTAATGKMAVSQLLEHQRTDTGMGETCQVVARRNSKITQTKFKNLTAGAASPSKRATDEITSVPTSQRVARRNPFAVTVGCDGETLSVAKEKSLVSEKNSASGPTSAPTKHASAAVMRVRNRISQSIPRVLFDDAGFYYCKHPRS